MASGRHCHRYEVAGYVSRIAHRARRRKSETWADEGKTQMAFSVE
jgi:hypothetical protein